MSTKRKKTPEPVITLLEGIKDEDYDSVRVKPFLDKWIYKIEYMLPDGDICINYIDDANKHIVLKEDSENYIVFHIEDGELDPSTMEKISASLSKQRKTNKNTSLCKDAILLQSCISDIDLSVAQGIIDKLNTELSKKCEGLYLHLCTFKTPIL